MLIVDVKEEQQKSEAEKDLLSSYMTAYFHRVEKLEPFETYRKRLDGTETEKKGMSDDEMLQKILQLHNTMNGATSEK